MNKDYNTNYYIRITKKSQKKSDFFIQICLVFIYDYNIYNKYIIYYKFFWWNEKDSTSKYFIYDGIYCMMWCES